MSVSGYFGNIAGRVALITGAASGIGAATAVLFARHGIKLSLIDKNGEGLERTQKLCTEEGMEQNEVLTLTGDITNNDDLVKFKETTLERYQAANILVNNVGTVVVGPIKTSTPKDVDTVMDYHVKAPLKLIQLLYDELVKSKGSIVNVSSATGHIPANGFGVYGISKAALAHLTRVLSSEMAASGVRVNTLSCGPVNTDILLSCNVVPNQEENDKVFDKLGSLTFAKRPASSEEMAKVILFLASDASSYMIGQDLLVDGGIGAATLVNATDI